MARDKSVSRRTAVKLAGAAASTALVAGCNGGDGNGDDGDGNGGGDSYEIDPDTEIRFEANQSPGWVGLEPSDIEDAENPTLVLQEGESYTFAWENGDGAGHNIEIRNDDGDVVDDLSTEVESGEDVEQTLEVDEVTSEMAQYVCQPHQTTMVGDIEVN